MRPRPTMYEQPRAVIAFARQLARGAVIAHIRDHGRKLREFTVSDIHRLAGDYVLAHPELMDEAKAICAELHQRELRKREWQRLRRAV